MHTICRSSFAAILSLTVFAPIGCDPVDEMHDEVEVLAAEEAEGSALAARPNEVPEDGEYTEDPSQHAEFDLAANLTPVDGPDGKTCCARCNSHQAYHALWGIESNCNFWAEYWCTQYDRRGLKNAAWLYVPSQCQP